MTKSDSIEVQNFLDEIALADSAKSDILLTLRKILLEQFPNASEKMMYGGVLFFIEGQMSAGLFVNKNHVTMEFSQGYQMNDKEGYLEGKGKYRRHLKFKSMDDILTKNASYYVSQCIDE